MARLAAQEKGEYYPTPVERVEDIAQAILLPDEPQFYRLFDPCCGKGIALRHLADLLQARLPESTFETWGVEISPERAAEAAGCLDQVLCAPFEMSTFYPLKSKSPVSLLFLNPPYDHALGGGRLEQQFLERSLAWAGPGCVLALIIPYKQLTWAMCCTLDEHYEHIQLIRFPDEEGPGGFEMFKQIVLLAQKRAERNRYDSRAVDALFHKVSTRAGLDAILALPTTPSPLHTLPKATRTVRLLRRGYTQAEILEACLADDLYARAAQQLYPTHADMPDPLRPPKDGHIAMMVASGLMGTLVTEGKAF